MKKTLVTLCCLFATWSLSAQPLAGSVDASLLPKLAPHYQPEFTWDRPTDPAAWKNLQGFQAQFGSTERLYFRKEVPAGGLSDSYRAVAWRGERVNAQLLLFSPDTVRQIRLLTDGLQGSNGAKISPQAINFELVRYVLGDYPYGDKNVVCGVSPYTDGFLMPDRFESFERFDLEGESVRPIWVSVNVPAATPAGTYTGTIEVRSLTGSSNVQLEIRVQDQLLPPPAEWNYRLDLWQNPWVVASYYNVEPWSTQHLELLKTHLRPYADAGGKYITTYGVHSPWADNSFANEGGMIEWIREADSSWRFDYSIFDAYVELAKSCGVTGDITLYTPAPWMGRHRYLDAATGNYITAYWSPDSPNFVPHWNAFLNDFAHHLKAKGWFESTYIGVNENPMNQTLATIRMVKANNPAWRITYAGDWHPELDTLLDDYSYLYGKEPTLAEQLNRKASGRSTTVYVCCNPAYPNNFIFSPPVEGRWISWYAMAHGYDGFLRWAYDAWAEDPMRDGRHGTWAAGDCYMVYPGGKSCIRFEKMREGIVDFEKMAILRKQVEQSNNAAARKLLQKLDTHLEKFLKETAFDEQRLVADITAGNRLVEELSDLLATKK